MIIAVFIAEMLIERMLRWPCQCKRNWSRQWFKTNASRSSIVVSGYYQGGIGSQRRSSIERCPTNSTYPLPAKTQHPRTKTGYPKMIKVQCPALKNRRVLLLERTHGKSSFTACQGSGHRTSFRPSSRMR